MFLRVSLAALILNAALPSAASLAERPEYLGRFFGMGFLNNAVPFTLFVWGQTHIASGLASILNATTPLHRRGGPCFTSDEKLTGNRLLGVLLGLAGVTVMIGPQALAGLAIADLGGDTLAQLACLGAALSYAFAGVYGRRFKRLGVAPLLTATGQVTPSAILLAPITVFAERPWSAGPEPCGAFRHLRARGLLDRARLPSLLPPSGDGGATDLLLVTFLLPVSSLVLGTFILAEPMVPTELLGMALIGLGLVAIDGRWPQHVVHGCAGGSLIARAPGGGCVTA